MASGDSPPFKQRKLKHLNSIETIAQLFAGKYLRCINQVFLSKGSYGSLYRGFWKEKDDSEEKEVAIRRIKAADCQETWKDVVDKHVNDNLNNDNVLKILGVETDANQSRYFALELYAATLEQYCTEQYTGPMPSDAQVLYQIARGVNHLHKKELAHGNLNPQTILISQSSPVRIKVSEFGLCKYYERDGIEVNKSQLPEIPAFNNMTSNFDLITDEARKSNRSNDQSELEKLSHPKYWTRAKYESHPVGQGGKRAIPRATPNGDTFAAGCLLFYYLKRGHPFGDTKSIVANISKMRPVNLKELTKTHFAFDRIKNLIGTSSKDGINHLITFASHLKDLLPLKIDEKTELGRGGFGIVFAGTFNGEKVAMKRIPFIETDHEAVRLFRREVKDHNHLDHDNVLKLLHVDEEKDPQFKYLVLELCAGTLTDCCENKYKGPQLPPDVLVLVQIASGLDYIHSRNLVHRDVKPDNILISSATSPVQMKLSDFCYCKKVSPQGTFTQSGLKGTLNWKAPELLEILNSDQDKITDEFPRGTIDSDTFAAGCVFFYFLTRGSHPFGKPTQVQANIIKGNPVLLNEGKLLQKENVAYAMIAGMIRIRDKRTKLAQVIQTLLLSLQFTITSQFKKVTRPLPIASTECVLSRFHPTDLVLACGLSDGQVIVFQTINGLVPFSYWGENKEKFTNDIIGKKVTALKWNDEGIKLLFWNTEENGDAGNTNHFLTMERDVGIWRVAWISENQVSLGLEDGRIEICQIDDTEGETTTERIIKRFKHGEVSIGNEDKEDVTHFVTTFFSEGWNDSTYDLHWNETTGYLAACSDDGWIKIWSMDSDQPVYSLEMDSPCMCLAWRRKRKTWSSDGGIEAARKSKENLEIVCGLLDGWIVTWNPLKQDEAKRKRILPQKHSDSVRSLSFSPDGRFLASADSDNEIIIWSTETWQPVYKCEKASRSLSWLSMDSASVPVYKLAVSPTIGECCALEQSAAE